MASVNPAAAASTWPAVTPITARINATAAITVADHNNVAPNRAARFESSSARPARPEVGTNSAAVASGAANNPARSKAESMI